MLTASSKKRIGMQKIIKFVLFQKIKKNIQNDSKLKFSICVHECLRCFKIENLVQKLKKYW